MQNYKVLDKKANEILIPIITLVKQLTFEQLKFVKQFAFIASEWVICQISYLFKQDIQKYGSLMISFRLTDYFAIKDSLQGKQKF